MRDAIKAHLYCWKKYSAHRYVYVNVAFGFPSRLLKRICFDGIIYHTVFLAMRWSPDIFLDRTSACEVLADLDVPKIALPQDEFIHTNILGQFLRHHKVTHLFTCASERDWRKIYEPYIDFDRVQVRTILTGYIDDDIVARVEKLKRTVGPRDIDIGYRAWRAEYWLGSLGRHKVLVGEKVNEAARARGMKCDISFSDKDVLIGDSWWRFLLRCKATVGAESGSSILDKDGQIRRCVDSFLSGHPNATFEEARQHCFLTADNELGLACVGPRHLEACITRTLQILIEGEYSGILKPWVHYIPLRKDYSNLEQVLDALDDQALVHRVCEAAYQDVVASKKWMYRNFVMDVDSTVWGQYPCEKKKWLTPLLSWVFRIRELLCWLCIQLEGRVFGYIDGRSGILGRLAYIALVRFVTVR